MSAAFVALGTFEQELIQILFLSLRVAAAMLIAPLFGAMRVPVQLRAFLGVSLAVFIFNWVDQTTPPVLFSIAGLVTITEEIVLGLALGFVLQIAFAVPMIAAEQISGTMGLAIATSIDPASGSQSGAVGQYFNLMLIFIFLALGAHLLWFELIIESYRTLPPGSAGLTSDGAMHLVEFAGLAFATAAAIALPVVLVLLLVQLVTGILSRSAPSLNLFALGLPAGVLAGIAALIAALPILTDQFSDLTETAITQVEKVIER